jgi:DivIVA domain-containing protein
MREEVRDVDFPIGLRGYDRGAVDRYVQRVNRLIAELEISSSPDAAIRAALEEVSEETRGLLERAHETADEITARSRAMADDRLEQAQREAGEAREAAAGEAQQLRETAEHETEEVRERTAHEAQELRETVQRETQELRERSAHEAHELTETAAREAQHMRETAEHEAHELTETAARESQHLRGTAERETKEMLAAAEARVRELDRNAEAIWRERRRLLENSSVVARQLLEIADSESARFARTTEAGADEPAPAAEPAAEDKRGKADEQPAALQEGAEGTSA